MEWYPLLRPFIPGLPSLILPPFQGLTLVLNEPEWDNYESVTGLSIQGNMPCKSNMNKISKLEVRDNTIPLSSLSAFKQRCIQVPSQLLIPVPQQGPCCAKRSLEVLAVVRDRDRAQLSYGTLSEAIVSLSCRRNSSDGSVLIRRLAEV